jgi:pyruvate/2-oxoglutarate dehydrogenase complex dihydrolipoamide acyltransferase (E2) component
MPIKITMPALSPTMTEGNLAKWLKKEGDAVKAGDVIAEIETDKATMEVEAVDEGILGKFLSLPERRKVPVNDVIALLLEEGESKDSLKRFEGHLLLRRKSRSAENGRAGCGVPKICVGSSLFRLQGKSGIGTGEFMPRRWQRELPKSAALIFRR